MTKTVHQLLMLASVWGLISLSLLRLPGVVSVFLGFVLFVYLITYWR